MTKPFTQWTTQDIKEYFSKLDRKTKIRLAGFFLGGLLLLIFIIWPAWISRFQVQAELQVLQNQIEKARATITQIPKFHEEKKEHKSFVEAARSRLLREDEHEGIVGIIASIAKKSEVALITTEPQESEQGGEAKFPPPFDTKYRKTTYWVTVEGGFHPFEKFVSELESHPKIFRVDDFSIVPKEETPRVHWGQIHVSAFSLIDEKEEGF